MLVRIIELGSEELEIQQNTSSGELGATVWDCALVIIQAFANKKKLWTPYFSGKRVLDMSCGTGAVGIAVAKLFQVNSVSLTDLPCLLPLINENVAKNGVKANVEPLVWGENLLELKDRPFDVIILSDVVTKAYSANYDKLIQSIWDLSHDDSKILLTVELRASEDKEFLHMLTRSGFEWGMIDDSLLDANWTSDDIRTFVVTKVYGENDALYK